MYNYEKYLNVYEFSEKLPGGSEVKFKPISTGQLKKLLTYDETDNPMVIDEVLDDIISTSVITEGFNLDNLYLQDRFFLLIELRKKSRGNTYKFQFQCEECGVQNIQSINLDKLKIMPFPKKLDNIVKLDDNLSIEMKYVTRGEQKQAYNFANENPTFKLDPPKDNTKTSKEVWKSKKFRQKMADMAIATHAMSINSIITPEGGDNVELSDKISFLNDIPQSFYEKITKWTEDNNFGVDFVYTTLCFECGKEEKRSIPLEDFFF